MNRPANAPGLGALGVMLASGIAGLGYQIVWTQQASLWLGHEATAVLAVVAAFFGGTALGARLLGERAERSADPARWYAACELAIAAWSLALALLLGPVSELLLLAIGARPSALRHALVAFGGTFLVLLPATAAMGATLPAMARIATGLAAQGRRVAVLYAANTLGATLGVVATAVWAIPELGLMRTALLCAALNVLCAAAAWRWRGRGDASMRPSTSGATDGDARPPSTSLVGDASGASLERTAPVAREALRRLALTGAFGIAYEVLVVRVLSQVAEDTVYTFALLLAVYLLGTALGAAVYARLAPAVADATWRARLLALQALACTLGIATLWVAPWLRDTVLAAAGPGMNAALVAEAALAVAAFFLPTIAMGALFAHLCAEACEAGASLGRALAWNTLGAALAPPLVAFAIVPAIGPKSALLGVAAGYLVLARHGLRAMPTAWLATAAAAALAFAAPPLRFVDVPDGGRLIAYREGALAAVSVVEDPDGVARLRINDRQQEGSSATLLADGRQALIPLLLHPAPRRALFLGLGTGITASTAALDADVRIDAVELLPEVAESSRLFTHVFDEGRRNPRLNVLVADARRYVRTSDAKYDLVVADNFHPARSGSAALYTVEHFRAIRARLADGGVFCQWLPLHQLDLPTLRIVVRSFQAAFPHGGAVLATNSLETPVIGLIARAGGAPFDVDAVRARLASARLRRPARAYGLDDEFAVLGAFVAGPEALAGFARRAPLNSDDRPVVAYRAPRVTYAPDSTPRQRLAALLDELHVAPGEVVRARDDDARRLAAYWSARDGFLAAGRNVRPTRDPAAMLAQVRDPLLRVLRTSPDFRPAYDPLLRIAVAVAPEDPDASREVLADLARLQPARTEAGVALERLADAGR